MTDTNILDKSMRSVFVGNIPYEATEEKLKDIFSEVGPVLSFKLVFDRETGKPKGYGFCEYRDQETALSAMRNLNGYEIGGRSLRVDNACTEKSRLEMQSLLAGPPVDNTYGDPVESDKAPEAISKAVASLPPEQMFELMKQMKICIQNNPAEGRQMLLQNPQLAYALLQAQVVMRIVDPQVAITMLHKVNPANSGGSGGGGGDSGGGPVATNPAPSPPVPQQPPPQVIPPPKPAPPPEPTALPPPRPGPPPPSQQPPLIPPALPPSHPMMPPQPPPMQPPMPVLQPPPPQHIIQGQDLDLRTMANRTGMNMTAGGVLSSDQDMRIAASSAPPVQPEPASRDPRSMYPRDPRTGSSIVGMRGPALVPGPVPAVQAPAPVQIRPPPTFPGATQPPTPANIPTSAIPGGASDQEKAALIMQVLQLSDEQIAMLPPEQRQSILVLKEQIAKSTQQR